MGFFEKIRPQWPLRLGLGLMYLYSGADIIRHPSAWYWTIRRLPDILERIITIPGIDRALFMQGVGEVFLGFLFLAWFLPRKFLSAAAGVAAAEMAAILLLVGLDSITFRDIGLLGAAAALAAVASSKDRVAPH